MVYELIMCRVCIYHLYFYILKMYICHVGASYLVKFLMNLLFYFWMVQQMQYYPLQ